MLAMVVHPDVQDRAHKELDENVGRLRPPTFADKQNLPFIASLVKEILRWRPVLPLGVPHVLTQDDMWRNHRIPEGTICIQNIWAMNRDPEVYGDDTERFRPDRFLDENGVLLETRVDMSNESHVTYGAGRR